MKNFQIVSISGDKYWISRSIAVAVAVYTIDEDGNYHILIEKRGEGCPDFVGCWCLPCGYVDWDETLEEAVIREVFEETGLDLKPYKEKIKLYNINSNPLDNNHQNITARYLVQIPYRLMWDLCIKYEIDSFSRGGEENEVENLTSVTLKDFSEFTYAWNHKFLINEILCQLSR